MTQSSTPDVITKFELSPTCIVLKSIPPHLTRHLIQEFFQDNYADNFAYITNNKTQSSHTHLTFYYVHFKATEPLSSILRLQPFYIIRRTIVTVYQAFLSTTLLLNHSLIDYTPNHPSYGDSPDGIRNLIDSILSENIETLPFSISPGSNNSSLICFPHRIQTEHARRLLKSDPRLSNPKCVLWSDPSDLFNSSVSLQFDLRKERFHLGQHQPSHQGPPSSQPDLNTTVNVMLEIHDLITAHFEKWLKSYESEQGSSSISPKSSEPEASSPNSLFTQPSVRVELDVEKNWLKGTGHVNFFNTEGGQNLALKYAASQGDLIEDLVITLPTSRLINPKDATLVIQQKLAEVRKKPKRDMETSPLRNDARRGKRSKQGNQHSTSLQPTKPLFSSHPNDQFRRSDRDPPHDKSSFNQRNDRNPSSQPNSQQKEILFIPTAKPSNTPQISLPSRLSGPLSSLPLTISLQPSNPKPSFFPHSGDAILPLPVGQQPLRPISLSISDLSSISTKNQQKPRRTRQFTPAQQTSGQSKTYVENSSTPVINLIQTPLSINHPSPPAEQSLPIQHSSASPRDPNALLISPIASSNDIAPIPTFSRSDDTLQHRRVQYERDLVFHLSDPTLTSMDAYEISHHSNHPSITQSSLTSLPDSNELQAETSQQLSFTPLSTAHTMSSSLPTHSDFLNMQIPHSPNQFLSNPSTPLSDFEDLWRTTQSQSTHATPLSPSSFTHSLHPHTPHSHSTWDQSRDVTQDNLFDGTTDSSHNIITDLDIPSASLNRDSLKSSNQFFDLNELAFPIKHFPLARFSSEEGKEKRSMDAKNTPMVISAVDSVIDSTTLSSRTQPSITSPTISQPVPSSTSTVHYTPYNVQSPPVNIQFNPAKRHSAHQMSSVPHYPLHSSLSQSNLMSAPSAGQPGFPHPNFTPPHASSSTAQPQMTASPSWPTQPPSWFSPMTQSLPYSFSPPSTSIPAYDTNSSPVPSTGSGYPQALYNFPATQNSPQFFHPSPLNKHYGPHQPFPTAHESPPSSLLGYSPNQRQRHDISIPYRFAQSEAAGKEADDEDDVHLFPVPVQNLEEAPK
ncbi:hypothetical protein BLNAU_4175 [Blattamonas nauphoetae]|uniref:RRM domain-containing protein n=1 Tax=Blattamonas nauphoetae TaxID=2049346 RepID=A0ABQ9YAH3_9EUKA|nr:hypothetical protein BLNAU_4175 [Blattamonas nauphoetae]